MRKDISQAGVRVICICRGEVTINKRIRYINCQPYYIVCTQGGYYSTIVLSSPLAALPQPAFMLAKGY